MNRNFLFLDGSVLILEQL
ncbi:MAG TPA: hypothetical protein DHV28_15095 [Ignavibacteriales bacterium]|nr:hypothetical protein [Ignavibacteriales bacterium]